MSTKIPSHFSLVKEHPRSYEIHDKRDNSRFHIAKTALSLPMHAKLSKIQKFDDGGTVQTQPQQPQPDPSTQTLGQRIGYPGFADGGILGNPEATEDMPYGSDTPQLTSALSIPMNLPGPAQTPDALPSNPSVGASGSWDVDSSAPEQQGGGSVGDIQPNPGIANPLITGANAVGTSLGNEIAAVKEGAKAEGAAGIKTAQAYRDFADSQDAMDTPNDIIQQRETARAALEKAYMDKTLDPDHYWNSKSTGQKITAGLGMILGGLGSGVTGHNYAVESINNAIDRDIDAQKNDQSKSMNLYKMNLEATQNSLNANLMTQNQMLSGVKARAMQFAAEAQGPEAKARAAQYISGLEQQQARNTQWGAMLSASQGGQMLEVDPSNLLGLVPEKDRAEAAKEIAANKTLNQTKQHVIDTFNQIKQINTVKNRLESPIQTAARVNALRDNASVELARDEAGRVNEFEFKAAQNNFHGVGNDNATDQIKLNNLLSGLNKKQNPGVVFKGATGIGLDNFRSTSTGANGMRQSQQMQQQPEIQTRNGVPYMKVPGGWRRVQ